MAFDLTQINVAEPKLGYDGGLNVALTYGADQAPLMLSSPLMLSFGVNTSRWGAGEEIHTVTLSFYGQAAEQPFLSVLRAMDEWLLATAQANTWKWLKSTKMSAETLRQQHFSTLRRSSAGVSNIKFKLKTTANGGYATHFYTNSKAFLATTADVCAYFTKGSLAAALIQCTGIWINSGRFGYTWKLHQLLVDPRRTPLQLLPSYNMGKKKEEEETITTCMIED